MILFKKAQQPGQIFVYILAIIVVGGIVLYGYNAIKDFSDRGEQVAFVAFKTEFENTVKTMVSDYGTIKRPDMAVSGKYKRVCVVDFSKPYSPGSVGTLCAFGDPESEPLVCKAWERGSQQYIQNPGKDIQLQNIFLTPDGSDSFNVDHITTGQDDAGMICAKVKNGKAHFQFKSLGDSVEITVP